MILTHFPKSPGDETVAEMEVQIRMSRSLKRVSKLFINLISFYKAKNIYQYQNIKLVHTVILRTLYR